MRNDVSQKAFGVVEGFFSKPLPIWSEKERLDTINFISENAKKINTYIYCPKDDQYVTSKWPELYPKNKLSQLKVLLDFCKSQKIRFVYGLNPTVDSGNDPRTSSLIVKKLSQLINIGCRNSCLLFDDIPLAYDVVDDNLGNTRSIGSRITNIVNNVYKHMVKQVDEFWFCSPDYCFKKSSGLIEELNKIHNDIPFMWSGRDVFVKDITGNDLKIVKSIVGKDRKIIWWSNYPANDCEQNIGVYNLGEFASPSQNVLKNLYGIVVNPMRESYANLPFYITFSNYISSPQKYDRKGAWENALEKLLGQKYRSYLWVFDEFSQRNLTNPNPKWLYKLLSQKKITGDQLEKLLKELKTLKRNVADRKWGSLFLKDVFRVFSDAEVYLLVLKDIIKAKSINKNLLLTIPYPTNIKVARYYPEIYKIVDDRLKLLMSDSSKDDKFIKFFQFKKEFNSKFIGGKKLKMTREEVKKFRKCNQKIVEFETECFLNVLNSRKINIRQKARIFASRQNINRFFQTA